MHVLIGENICGRDFVVGDIHGHYELLMEELSYEGFDSNRDRVFSVGDLIDRGPDSQKCLTLLDKPWFFSVRGNHEQMMVDCIANSAFQNWRRNYGQWLDKMVETEISEWAIRLAELPIAMTVLCEKFSVGICHAEPSGRNWNQMISNPSCHKQMMWGRTVLRGEGDLGVVKGVDFTVHGHTPIPQPRRIGNRYFLDTGAGDGGRLTLRNLSELFKEYSDYKVFS